MKSAHSKNSEIGEVAIGLPLLFSIALAIFLPVRITQNPIASIYVRIAGALIIITGLFIIINARRQLVLHNQPTDPGFPTTKIVKTGVYSISRNPMYLGALIFFVGVGLLLNTVWIFITFFPAVLLCYYILIVPEEQYLSEKFESEFAQYKCEANCWVGRGMKRPPV